MYYVFYFGQRLIRTAQATKEKYYQDGSSHERLPELGSTFTDTSPGLAYGIDRIPVDLEATDTVTGTSISQPWTQSDYHYLFSLVFVVSGRKFSFWISLSVFVVMLL